MQLLHKNLEIKHVSNATIYAIIVYIIVATRKLIFDITKVTIKNIAKMIAATKAGHFNTFCNAIEIMITAIGIAKNISKIVFIINHIPFLRHKSGWKRIK